MSTAPNLPTFQGWDFKKDGRQVKKTYTGKVAYDDRGRTVPVVKISGTITIVVLTTRADIDPLTLLSLLEEAKNGPPKVGDVYTEGNTSTERTFYIDATPRLVGPRGALWEWEVQYTVGGVYLDAPATPQEQQAETLLQFSTSVDLEDYATACDLDGNWNCNTNGEFFADPLLFKNGVLNLVYKYREYFNPLALSRDYFQCVNLGSWYGFPEGTVKVADISFDAVQTTKETYYDTTYKLQYRPSGWNVEKANAGFYYKSGGSLFRCANSDGSPTEEPLLLASDGSILQSGSPYMLSYRMNSYADLGGLQLPNPFTLEWD